MSGQPSRQPPSHPARPIIPATMPSSKNRKQPIGHGVGGSIADFHSAAPVFGSRLLVRVPPSFVVGIAFSSILLGCQPHCWTKVQRGQTKRRILRRGAAPSHRESVSGSGSGQEGAAEKRGKRGKRGKGGNKTKAIALQTRLHAWNHISTSRRTSNTHALKKELRKKPYLLHYVHQRSRLPPSKYSTTQTRAKSTSCEMSC